MKPRFIVIEGIDGSGKSTQVDMIDTALTDANVRHYITREASDGPIGKLLRTEYLSGKRKCDERVINRLYAADRLDHITNTEDGLLKHLNDGEIVICDRYVLSSLAYDTYSLIDTDKFYDAFESIININKVNMELLQPDITIVLDLPQSTALERIQSRGNDNSIYETSEKLWKIRKAYHIAINKLKEVFNQNIVVINGDDSITDIHSKIMDVITPMIREE